MEFVSHSIMLTSYRYLEPQFGGVISYGEREHSHLFEYHLGRMSIPLKMEEEPVFVNENSIIVS